MRLPKDWLKAAMLIGGVGDWQSADVSNFVMEFRGHPEDLRQRLIGQSFDSYVRRQDVSFVFREDAPYMDQATGDYLGKDDFENESDIDNGALHDSYAMLRESLDKTGELLAAETRRWLTEQNEVPSPELPRAWSGVFVSTLASSASQQQDADHPGATPLDGPAVLDVMMEELEAPLKAQLRAALAQISRHLKADPDVAERLLSQLPREQFVEQQAGEVVEQE
jgi:hypothetical protein